MHDVRGLRIGNRAGSAARVIARGMLAWSAVASARPRVEARAWPPPATGDPRYFFQIMLGGGIDAIYSFDPKERSEVEPRVDVPFASKDIVTVGNVRLGPHVRDLAPRDGADRGRHRPGPDRLPRPHAGGAVTSAASPRIVVLLATVMVMACRGPVHHAPPPVPAAPPAATAPPVDLIEALDEISLLARGRELTAAERKALAGVDGQEAGLLTTAHMLWQEQGPRERMQLYHQTLWCVDSRSVKVTTDQIFGLGTTDFRERRDLGAGVRPVHVTPGRRPRPRLRRGERRAGRPPCRAHAGHARAWDSALGRLPLEVP